MLSVWSNKWGLDIGYLLYRITRRVAKITHLCVPVEHRRKGIAKKLLSLFKVETADLLGISLRCRRDYEASKIWSKFGFVAVDELVGRGRIPMKLTCWQYNHNHPDLFSRMTQDLLRSKLCVVIDANTFYDLDDPTRTHFEESNSLLADWLADSVEICLVDEIHNEIDRNGNETIRKNSKAKARGFTLLSHDNLKFDKVIEDIRRIFPAKNKYSDRDESDLRQIAKTVCSPAKYFVTRDQHLLEHSEQIEKDFGLKILRPVDLIIRLDELQRENEYEPVSLSGTTIQIRLVSGQQQNNLSACFQSSSLGESKSQFQQIINKFLSKPDTYQTFVIQEDGKPLALFVYDKTLPDALEIPLFRVQDSTISATLIRHLILKFVSISSVENRKRTIISDKKLTRDIILAVEEEGFIKVANGFFKIHLLGVTTGDKFANYLRSSISTTKEEAEKISSVLNILDNEATEILTQTYSDIEKLFFPVKISDSTIPCFIVSIKPGWAMELFDEQLANETMYGAKSDLALRIEQVYYRSAINAGGLKAPGRILWYVSQGSHLGSGAIRACSMLDEVLIDIPKNLYRKFKRLGIYDWKTIYMDLAKGNLENKIMALRFSKTELFNKPIFYHQLKKIIESYGSKINLQSPSVVSTEIFMNLYGEGVNK